jgi:hypothetical protein
MGANITLLDEEKMGANTTLFGKEKKELNAEIGRWFNARTPNSGIEQYIQVTSIMKSVKEIQRALDEAKRPRASGCGSRTCRRLGSRRTKSLKNSC